MEFPPLMCGQGEGSRSLPVNLHENGEAGRSHGLAPGSAAKAALNDCPHERKAKVAHLAILVGFIALFYARCEDARHSIERFLPC